MANFYKLSDEEIQDLFEATYLENVGSLNSIGEIEAKCERELGSNKFKIELTIFGLAGTPTLTDYENGSVEGSESVVIEREDQGSLKFNFVPGGYILNSNDYVVLYESE